MKKVIALLLAMSMTVAAFTGCTAGQKASEEKKTETADKTSDKKEDGDKVYHIGIIQLVEHQALDAATEGFQKALKEKLGDKVEFDVQNAQGEETNCATIATKFVNSNVDLIMANATQAVISSATATSDIPIVGTSVTDYVTTGTVKSNDAPGGNVTGTSDLAPIDQQVELLQKLVPDAKNVGILYCSAEANSVYQAEQAQTGKEPFHFESLAGIDDQIAKALSCSQKFSDDHTHETKSDIDFHGIDDGAYVGGDDDFGQHLKFCAAQGIDQEDLFRICGEKCGVQI